ncbi:hypothetical protein OG244_03850 [Streptomyces brevispora]|uniref:hypothetical protein n=1 Tax=Streptomyces brevispora TaxID=887462 RepID=UPI002E2FE894|nr:hypothetical protein [Streptomyces brevispora]
MINNRVSDALSLRAMASEFDAQRGKLPQPGDPHRSTDNVTIARQLSDLGKLITDLADEVLHRAAEQNREGRTPSAIDDFAAAIGPASEAASALGAVAHQLSFLGRTEHLRDQPDALDAREAAAAVMDDGLGAADTALREGADSLHAASARAFPPPDRLQAARRRSATATSAPAPPAAAPAAAVLPGPIARGR